MMATVQHVTSGLGLRKLQADGFLLTRVYVQVLSGEFWEEKNLPVRGIKLRLLCCLFCNLGRYIDYDILFNGRM